MRITIRLPDDLHEKVAVDALRKPHNSKEAVIAEILRAHYGGGRLEELARSALAWRIDRRAFEGISGLRRQAKVDWK